MFLPRITALRMFFSKKEKCIFYVFIYLLTHNFRNSQLEFLLKISVCMGLQSPSFRTFEYLQYRLDEICCRKCIPEL